MEAPALHLSERSEVWTNSTARARRPCPGALLITEPSGRQRLVSAHRGARSCADGACRERYRRRLFAIARAGVREGHEDGIKFVKLLTLTAPSRIEIPVEYIEIGWNYKGALSGRTQRVAPFSEHAYRYMAQAFNRFMTAARRRWTFSYFRVIEEGGRTAYTDRTGRLRHGTARVHYHLLVMCEEYMPQRELSALARRAKLGRILDIRAAESDDDMARYMAKYATKESGQKVPRGLRFFVMSHDWAARTRATRKRDVEAQKEARRAAGWRFEYVSDADVAVVARALAAEPATPAAEGSEESEWPSWSPKPVEWTQLELDDAA